MEAKSQLLGQVKTSSHLPQPDQLLLQTRRCVMTSCHPGTTHGVAHQL